MSHAAPLPGPSSRADPDPSGRARHVVRPMSRAQRVGYRTVRMILEIWCRLFWRMQVVGRDRLPDTGPFVLTPVHRSFIDFAVIGAATPRIMRFMAKDSLWESEALGQFLDQMGAFPVHRETVDRPALRNCEEALSLGDPVVMFPEGRRESGATVAALHEGPAWLACRNRVPIVPVGLGRTDRALPLGAKFPRPVRVRVLIGEPIYPNVPLEGRVPRGAVAETTDELYAALQKLYALSNR